MIYFCSIHPRRLGRSTDFIKKSHEGVRKGIEKIFGVLYGRFRILHGESVLWSVEDVVQVSEVCVILHNFLVRMRQSGALDEEILNEDDQFDFISRFMDKDTDHLCERGEEQIAETDASCTQVREGHEQDVGV